MAGLSKDILFTFNGISNREVSVARQRMRVGSDREKALIQPSALVKSEKFHFYTMNMLGG